MPVKVKSTLGEASGTYCKLLVALVLALTHTNTGPVFFRRNRGFFIPSLQASWDHGWPWHCGLNRMKPEASGKYWSLTVHLVVLDLWCPCCWCQVATWWVCKLLGFALTGSFDFEDHFNWYVQGNIMNHVSNLRHLQRPCEFPLSPHCFVAKRTWQNSSTNSSNHDFSGCKNWRNCLMGHDLFIFLKHARQCDSNVAALRNPLVVALALLLFERRKLLQRDRKLIIGSLATVVIALGKELTQNMVCDAWRFTQISFLLHLKELLTTLARFFWWNA